MTRRIDEDTNTTKAGANYILAIAVESYDSPLRRLHTPKQDCEKIIEILTERYEGFENSPAYVTLLHQPSETTRTGILEGIQEFAKDEEKDGRNELGEEDTLWLIYAGHGSHSKETGDGYLLPVDGKKGRISISDLANELNAIPAGKIVLIVDSCFAGALADAPSRGGLRVRAGLNRPFVIASGALHKVEDGIGHSPFAKVFIQLLRENREEKLSLSDLEKNIVQAMPKKAQKPWGRLMNSCGADYGDSRYFLTLKAPPKPAPPSPPVEKTLKELIQELYRSV